MKLNMKQKEYLLDKFLEPGDLHKLFDSISRDYTLKQDWEIMPDAYDWWALFYQGDKLTTLNFATYPEVLEKIKALA